MLKKVLIILVLGAVAIVLLGAASYSYLKEEKIATILRGGGDEVEHPFSVLVLGQVGPGQGGQWHFAPDLADAIVLLHLNSETNVVNLISLPRDLYGDFGDERIKINKVVSEGQITDLLNKLPEITGIEVGKFVVLDLSLVEEVVDGLGGIEVELPEAVYDPVGSFHLAAGPNALSGEDAAWLIRNRYAPEGDFFRERNQHLILEAVFDKFDGLSAFEKTSFIFRMLPHISKSTANFSLGEAIPELRDVEEVGFNSIVLDFDTKLWDSVKISNPASPEDEAMYVILPKEGINNYRAVREYIGEHLR